jgi:hypothetical protein
MNEPCRNIGCNYQRDGRCTGVACGGADFVKQVATRAQKLSTRCFYCGKQLEMGNYMFDVASKNYVCLRCYKPNPKAK